MSINPLNLRAMYRVPEADSIQSYKENLFFQDQNQYERIFILILCCKLVKCRPSLPNWREEYKLVIRNEIQLKDPENL